MNIPSDIPGNISMLALIIGLIDMRKEGLPIHVWPEIDIGKSIQNVR